MKDIALDELILRRYEIPSKANERELVRKFCLSLGLLQEGDSRDIIVDILLGLIKVKKDKKFLSSEEIKEKVIELRKVYGLELKGVSESNIRRQLKRLRDLFLIEKIKNKYRIAEFNSIEAILESKILNIKLKGIIDRIKIYAKALDEIK